MTETTTILLYGAGFLVIAIASHQVGKYFQGHKLPLITGYLITGILAGPHVLNLLPKEGIEKINFITEFALAFIAFAAGSELYLKEFRDRSKSIAWMTAGQAAIPLILGSICVYWISGQIPFMQKMGEGGKWGVSILIATIFIARSPASVIAVINELRARGPFTQTALGVTVISDALVIILFAFTYSIADTLFRQTGFDLNFILRLLIELSFSLAIGYLLGKFLEFILSIRTKKLFKTLTILLSGYSIYLLSHFAKTWTTQNLPFYVHLEPLLICIIASFIVSNFSRYRHEFLRIIHDASPYVYVAFFTLIGSTLNLKVFQEEWLIALVLVGFRLFTLAMGSVGGGILGGDSMKTNNLAWMPYITQAGVAVGLATEIASQYQVWGVEFETLMIGMIIINQAIGPPLFKYSLLRVGEGHPKAPTPEFDGIKDALIFGLHGQALALARHLKRHGWVVKIAAKESSRDELQESRENIYYFSSWDLNAMEKLDTRHAEAIVTLLNNDEDNYHICEMAYENYGTRNLVVKLNERENYEKFNKIGAKVVEASSAIVNLLDHFIRSPQATSLLLGMEKNQDTTELEVRNRNLHGLALRDLRLPKDIIILSLKRDGQTLISHGYTRLRIGDFLTVVGSRDSIKQMELKFEG